MRSNTGKPWLFGFGGSVSGQVTILAFDRLEIYFFLRFPKHNMIRMMQLVVVCGTIAGSLAFSPHLPAAVRTRGVSDLVTPVQTCTFPIHSCPQLSKPDFNMAFKLASMGLRQQVSLLTPTFRGRLSLFARRGRGEGGGGMKALFADPAVVRAMQNPKVMQAMMEMQTGWHP